MILRSSSNPLTPTLLSPFSSHSPNRSDFHSHTNLIPISLHNNQESINTTTFRIKGLRRAWSDSSLDKFAYLDHNKEELKCSTSYTPRKFPRRNHTTMLQSAPSFSIFSDEDLEVEKEKNGNGEKGLMRTVTIGDCIETGVSGDFSFGEETMAMGLIKEEEGENEQDEEILERIEELNLEQIEEPVSPPMYLASGLGIHGFDFGGGGLSGGSGGGGFDSGLPHFDENGGDIEEYYKRMVDQFPCHPLFLSNYAQLLESKGDLHGAEEYYHQATLADPEDGEILMKYAKLDWQLNHDKDRALSNFDLAVQAAPRDSHVLAAYANFLWEIDDDGEEDNSQPKRVQVKGKSSLTQLEEPIKSEDSRLLQLQSRPKADIADGAAYTADKGYSMEEYYKKMVEENPSSSLVLRNYAQFLYKAKGDLQGAKEYYSRAMLADPGDGEIKSQYAKLVWELHRDQDKASSYFEQAVQATPEDSQVLGAYASFLWETEENEDDSTSPDQFQEAICQGTSVAAATAQV